MMKSMWSMLGGEKFEVGGDELDLEAHLTEGVEVGLVEGLFAGEPANRIGERAVWIVGRRAVHELFGDLEEWAGVHGG